jgi:hypothetical protein
MSDEMGSHQDLSTKLETMEKGLHALNGRLDDIARNRVELDKIAGRLPELKTTLAQIQKDHSLLEQEIAKLDEQIHNIGLKSAPVPICNKIIADIFRSWKKSKALLLAQVVAVLMMAAAIGLWLSNNSDLQPVATEAGLLVIILIFFVAWPKYRQLSGYALLALVVALVSNWPSDQSAKLGLVSLSIALVGLGFAAQAFVSSQPADKRLDSIDQKVTALLRSATPPPEEHPDEPQNNTK